MKCVEIMTKDPEFCLAATPVYKVAEKMLLQDVGAIPIVDGIASGKVVGIVTDRDLTVSVVARGLHPRTTPVSHVMCSFPTAICSEDDDVSVAVELMEAIGVRRIPVVDKEQHLRGIITLSDIVSRLNDDFTTLKVVESLSHCRVPPDLMH